MNYYPEFGELLNKYLLERSASSLARALDVHPSTVAKWLNGDSRPRDPETVMRIADILGIYDRNGRQKLMEAAGYAYVDKRESGVKTDDRVVSSSEETVDLLSGTEQAEETENECPEADSYNGPVRSSLNWIWLNHPKRVATLMGLILLAALGHPLLSDWLLGEIIYFAFLCMLSLAITVWLWRKPKVRTELSRFFDNHSPRAKMLVLTPLILSILLWGAVGRPKLWGIWSYPGQDEDGDRFGHVVATGDFNGDDKADLVIGTPGEAPGLISSARAGWIYTHYGTANRPKLGTNFGQAWLGLNEKGDQFGWSMAVGDFNGDGLDDLAVGAPGEARGSILQAGYVFLYKGTERGLVAWQGVGQDELGSNEVNDHFGWALAAGDFNGDGRDDLAIGAPGETPGTSQKSGYVFVFTGTANGLQHWFGYDQEGLSTNEKDDLFGSALAAGDFNGDGVEDLAIGAPGEVLDSSNNSEGSPSGAVYVFLGDIHGLQQWARLGQPTPTENAQFGWSLAIGDFNNDKKDDLAIGAPQAIPDKDSGGLQSGYVYIFHGASKGFSFSQGIDQTGLDHNEDNDQFGWVLATGNLNGDRNVDLIISAPGEVVESEVSAPKSGYVYAFTTRDGTVIPWFSLDQENLGNNDEGDLFGWSLATGDFDSNGKDELIVGAPGETTSTDNRSGYVFIFRASTTGMTGWIGYHQE